MLAKSKSFLAGIIATGLLLGGGAAWAQTSDDVDPVNDLAGLVLPNSDGTTGTLYTTSGERSSILGALGATTVDSTHSRITITNSTGTTTTITVAIVIAVFPALFLPPGDLICANNVVRVYRNSSCRLIFPATSSGCFPFTGGNFARVTTIPYRKCKRGVGFCIEVNRIYSTRTVYFDNMCTISTAVQTANAFIC